MNYGNVMIGVGGYESWPCVHVRVDAVYYCTDLLSGGPVRKWLS